MDGVLDDRRGAYAAGLLRHLGEIERHSRQVAQDVLRRAAMLRRIGLETLQVDSQGRAFRSGARKPVDDPRVVSEGDADALVFGHGAVHGIDVGEVVAGADRQGAQAPSRQAWKGPRATTP